MNNVSGIFRVTTGIKYCFSIICKLDDETLSFYTKVKRR